MCFIPRLLQHSPEVHLNKLSDRAQELIAIQRRRYIDSMPDKREVINQCLAQASAAALSGEADLCETLFQQVHRLAGSAGSYGFESLGQAALVIDRYLIANSSGVSATGVNDLPGLASMLQNLLDEIDDIIRKSG